MSKLGGPRQRPDALALDLTEKEWDAQLFQANKGLAPMLGWTLSYHTLRSKGSRSGFPDRVLVRDRVLYAELKRADGKPTDTQAEWLDKLAAAGAEVYLWRPDDLDEIARILTKRWRLIAHRLVDANEPFRQWQPHSLWLPGIGRADTQHKQAA